MQARMNNPVMVIPEAMRALHALRDVTKHDDVPPALLELVQLRASQINGCAMCVKLHTDGMRRLGESEDRIALAASWREAPYFSDAERAALALAEAATRLSDREDPVADEIWAEAAKHYDEQAIAVLCIAIAHINLWNRLNVMTRQIAGSWG
jgi:AhpD family alkylhydroperoxidase